MTLSWRFLLNIVVFQKGLFFLIWSSYFAYKRKLEIASPTNSHSPKNCTSQKLFFCDIIRSKTNRAEDKDACNQVT